jgi:signal transduction histidine kinase
VGWLGGPAPELPHSDASLRVSVRSTVYSRREALRYQFRLEDQDADWSEPRREPFRDLMRLAPGRHRLLARAALAEGPWSEPVALEFRIEPAWWQTAAFPWIAGIGLVGLVASGLGLRQARVRQLERELERRIAERTDDLARYADALSEHLQTVDKASDRARQAERARRDLFARASHELRTPLTAVLGFSELLERALGERLEAKERRYLANVRESSELLLRQINELLEHLKLESGRVEVHLDEVALESMVDSVASLMEGFALHRGVRLEIDRPAGLPVVRVDVAKLRQVLMNLVSNAVKFSPAGGTVTLEVGALDAAAAPWGTAGYRITVRDQGPGIPAGELETIFEPYRRLASAQATAPGTGLGLPIARQFVELLGGRLEVETAPGAGASFRVLLPIDPGPLVPQLDASDSRPLETLRAQVLVLDADRERFARLVGGFGDEELLAVRVEDADALRRALGSLRPRALVLPFDPAGEDGWWQVAPVLRQAREQRLQLVLVPTVGGRALALPFAGVLAPDAEEAEVRRTLRVAGIAPRHTGRRPLVLIAGAREAGVEIGVGLGAAGCDHFRVEGHEAVRAALVEASPDAVATDVAHALGLAAELARRPQPDGAVAAGWILFEAGAPEELDLVRLTERVIAEGDDAESALGPALARLLGRGPAVRGAG